MISINNIQYIVGLATVSVGSFAVYKSLKTIDAKISEVYRRIQATYEQSCDIDRRMCRIEGSLSNKAVVVVESLGKPEKVATSA
jgi:hypothetical protein